ncbi:hypothetical protein ABZ027_31655 [Streptomyces sp. NPDC006332]|uniref:hypothetical protein n=1 Tax=Streptomyces sp. NPDC006332 TaxID=3155456 RepID=UPI0033BCBF5D
MQIDVPAPLAGFQEDGAGGMGPPVLIGNDQVAVEPRLHAPVAEVLQDQDLLQHEKVGAVLL